MAIDASRAISSWPARPATINGGGTTYDEFAIVRFASDGSLDSTFGNGGVVLDDSGRPRQLRHRGGDSPLSPGRGPGRGAGIVVAGRSTCSGLDLVRYLPDGSEDPNFQNWNAAGLTATAVNSVVIQPNNMILVGGSFLGDRRTAILASRGSTPTARWTTILATTAMRTNYSGLSAADGLVIQPDGSVITAGVSFDPSDPGNLSDPSNVPLLARLTAGDVGGAEVRVDNASPALPLSGDSYVAAGDTYTLTLGSPLPRERVH